MVFVVSPGLDTVVADADLAVRVSDGDVNGESVAEVVVSVEVEFSERSVGDVELDYVYGSEDEPENKGGEAEDENDGEDYFEYEADEAAAAASAAT